MKFLSTVLILLEIFCQKGKAGLYQNLYELKMICDAKLMIEQECTIRKDAILNEQNKAQEIWYSNYKGKNTAAKQFSTFNGNSFSEVASASSIIKDILDEAGLAPKFIVRPSNVPNAVASPYDGIKFIGTHS